MTNWKLWLVGAAMTLAMGSCLAGCQSQDQTAQILDALRQGKARGHLVLVTNGELAAGITNKVFFGPTSTTLSFDGNINYGDTNIE